MSRKEEIRTDIEDLLNKSVEKILQGADQLLANADELIEMEDKEALGPMVLPKDILVALLLREAWAWGPPSMQISIKVSAGASKGPKRSIRTINALRNRLGDMP